MRYGLTYSVIGRLRNHLGGPPEERVWEFGYDQDLAMKAHREWTQWMAEGLWEFRDWGWPGEISCIKPGALIELDFRISRLP